MWPAVIEWVERASGTSDPVGRARVRVQHLIVLLLNLVGLPYVVFFAALGLTVTAGVLLAVIGVGTAGLLLLTRRGRPRLGGQVVSFGFFFTITVALVGRGGMTSNSAAWLLLAPVLAFMMVGPRHGMLIGAAAALEFVAQWAAEALGLPFPAGLPADIAHWMIIVDYPIIALTISAILRVQASIWDGVIDRLDTTNASLEEQVVVRQRAEQSALAAANARYTFLATMSHEIRTPLNGVLGLTDVLLDSELSEDQRNLAGTVRDSGQLLRTLLDDVLDFSKIDSGQLEIEAVPFDLRALCADIVRLWAAAAGERGLDLSVKAAAGAPSWIVSDPTRLRQILGNLVSNAIKFTSRGHVWISISAEDDRLTIVVEDTGMGVAEGAIDQIFEPFRQADSTTTREHGGTGLGLAICQRLATAMGGGITVRSEVGVGTAFTVELPLEVAQASEADALVERAPDALQGLRVLVAEDNAVNRMVIKRMLERHQLEVQVVEDGAACVEAWRAERPDLIFMDCQMPVLDGYDATRRLREEGARLPIVALTANTMPGDRARCLGVGMNDHLGKPIRAAELAQMLGRWLRPEDVLSGVGSRPASGDL